MKVLLVANYEPDRQESMLRFAAVLAKELPAEGIDVTTIRPPVVLGRFRFRSGVVRKWLGYVDKFILFPRQLRAEAQRADLVHLCDHSNAMYLPCVRTRPHLVTCNDLLAVRSALGEFPEHPTGRTGRMLQHWILTNLRKAHRVTCISEATRADVLRLTQLPVERVGVTYMGLNHPYAPVPSLAAAAANRRMGAPFDTEVFAANGLPFQPFILHVGGTQWYKNRPGVLGIHRALRTRLGADAPQLVIVGPADEPLPAGVTALRGVSEAGLAALYSAAECLLFPSIAEGFGWPIVEAQSCGCIAVTTRRAPMTEIGGEAAIYLDDPIDYETGAARIAELLARPQEYDARRQSGLANAQRFSTGRMIAEYRALYREIVRS